MGIRRLQQQTPECSPFGSNTQLLTEEIIDELLTSSDTFSEKRLQRIHAGQTAEVISVDRIVCSLPDLPDCDVRSWRSAWR